MITIIRRTLADEQGVSLAEYALLLGLIAVVCVGAVTLVGTQVQAALNAAAAGI